MQFTSAPAINTIYTATGDPSALQGLVGQTISLRLGTASSDNVRPLSTNYGTSAANWPQLTLTFTPTSGADTTPPSKPAGVTATPQGANGVTVGWTASTDNVGVTSYDVYRGGSAGFTPDATNKVGTSAGSSFADSNVPNGTYYYKVIANDAAGNHSDASDPAQIGIGDTQAPTAPGNVSASATNNAVTVTWTASSDDVGVTGYTVYRGTTNGFTPGAGNKVDDTSASTLTLTQSNVANGTYFYKVVAHDAAAHDSAAGTSNAVTVQVGGAQAQTIKVTPTADAMTPSTAPTTNYGTYNQLSARGTTGQIESFLRYSLPAAPAGTTLTSVSVSVRTSGDSTAATVDPFWLDLSTPTNWDELAINWNNRPTTVGARLVQFTSAPAINTLYSAAGDPSALQGLLGQVISLRLGATSADNVRLLSTNYGTSAANWPTLTLNFTPTP